MPEKLPRFEAAMERIADQQKLGEILLEAGRGSSRLNGRVYRRSADGHRTDRRRGLPIISKGVGGTSPGTDPLRALLARKLGANCVSKSDC